MQVDDSALTRDFIVAFVRLSARAWLKLQAAAKRVGQPHARARGHRALAGPDPAATVSELARMAERGVWRCETLALLQGEAETAITEAEDDYCMTLARCADALAAKGCAQGSEPGNPAQPLAA